MKNTLLGIVMMCTVSCGTTKEIPVDYQEYILTDGNKAFVSNYVRNRIAAIYDGKTKELPLCLTGYNKNKDVYVEDIELPWYLYNDNVSSLFSNFPCGEKYVGMIHNHPVSNNCSPSIIDILRFVEDEKAIVEMVVCGDTNNPDTYRYSVTTKIGEVKK